MGKLRKSLKNMSMDTVRLFGKHGIFLGSRFYSYACAFMMTARYIIEGKSSLQVAPFGDGKMCDVMVPCFISMGNQDVEELR